MTPRDAYLRRTYGITEDEYETLLASQGGGCAICGKKPKPGSPLVVDHSHVTGQVRGVLCGRRPSRNCNRGLPWFEDNADWFEAAADYLREPPANALGLNRRPASPRQRAREE